MGTRKVVTRIPPSPTGNLNIGSARTALFNFLYAKKHNGKVIYRSEDTDKERSERKYEENILEGLEWLGISYDEFYRQSERGEVYKKYLEKMVKEDKAYVSKEEEGESSEVIRFRNPNKEVAFTDLIRGDISFDTTELGDFVIAKNLDSPLYHLAVVVDDFEMGVTHVIRGEDGISNTPRQILIQEAIDAPRPTYAHLPLVLNKEKRKLSKRDGVKSISEYRNEGYFPEAIVNYLALIGWNPGTEQEIFSMDELIEAFELEKVQKSGAIYNEEKLRWFNNAYIKNLDDKTCVGEIKKRLPEVDYEILERAKSTIIERISIFDDISEEEYRYLADVPEYGEYSLLWKGEGSKEETAERLDKVLLLIKSVEDFSKEKVKEAVWPLAEEIGRGEVLWPMRYALSGRDKSPDPFELSYILGKDETLKRIQNAIEKLR